MKGLFLFQRYLPLIDTAWLVFYRQPNHLSTTLNFLAIIFSRSNGAEFNGDCVSEYIPGVWRFVNHWYEAEWNSLVSGSSISDCRTGCVRE